MLSFSYLFSTHLGFTFAVHQNWPVLCYSPLELSGALLKSANFQALLQMLEKEVLLQCREKDKHLVEKLLPECLDALEKQWGEKCNVGYLFS